MEDIENKQSLNENDAKKYLDGFLASSAPSDLGSIKKEITNISSSIQKPANNLQYQAVNLDMLPMGVFYKLGTKILIRPATVGEVQAYSVVDDKNYVDVCEKMNEMLASCVKIIFPNGMNGSYKDIKDGDRLYLVFMIREMTFEKGNTLSKDVVCDCNHEFKMEFRATPSGGKRTTFVKTEMPEDLIRFFNEETRLFHINIDDVEYKLAPPNIGVQEAFFNDIKNRVQTSKKPNVSFTKIVPYTLYDRNNITEEGIKKKEDEFKRMGMKQFQILNSFVDTMLFGIKELCDVCPSCGMEVHSDMTFPGGASGIFIVRYQLNELVG